MEVKVKTIDIEQSGIVETADFAIKASAQSFRILSDGLYSDKIMAVIRELSSNAYDAHVEAGTEDTPFFVHLPNQLEPWFTIRDFGIGLSHKDVMVLYRTYFETTKDKSNAFTGALGLGSKSPFSYAETFTVTSYFEGQKRTYIVDLGEAGVPRVGLVKGFPMDTDEHNGLEIQIAVKQADFYEFETKAQTIYKRYKPLPDVVGVKHFELEPVKYSLQGDEWRVIDGGSTGNYSTVYAIQGTVAYPIDKHALRRADSDAYDSLFGLNLELDFPIGELDIAANREALGYDERTIKNILARAEVAVKEIGIELSKKFKSCNTMWEARKLWTEQFGNGASKNSIGKLVEEQNIEILWHKKEIKPHIRIDMEDNLSIDAFNINVTKRTRRYGNSTSRVKMRKFTKGTANDYFAILAADNVQFFIDDLGKGVASRIRHYIDEQEDGNIEVYLVKNKTKTALNELKTLLGGAPFRDVSELPKPTKAARVTSGDARGNAYIFHMKSSADRDTSAREFWVNDVVDFRGGGFYLPIHRHRIERSAVDQVYTPILPDSGRIDHILKLAKDLDIFDHETETLFGIPKGQVEKLKGTWTNLFDFINESVGQLVNDSTVSDLIANNMAIETFRNNVNRPDTVVRNIASIIKGVNDTNNSIVQFNDVLVSVNEKADSDESLDDIAAIFKIDIVSSDPVDLVSDWKGILKAYPMLIWCMEEWREMGNSQTQNVIDYVNLVDTAAKIKLDSIKAA